MLRGGARSDTVGGSRELLEMRHHPGERIWINQSPPYYAQCHWCSGSGRSIVWDGAQDVDTPCEICAGTGLKQIPTPEIMECWG